MIKGVIFDMDGVLVDNRDAHIEAFEIICRKYGVPFDCEKFMPTFGMTNDLILERLMPEVIKTTEKDRRRKGKHLPRNLRAHDRSGQRTGRFPESAEKRRV